MCVDISEWVIPPPDMTKISGRKVRVANAKDALAMLPRRCGAANIHVKARVTAEAARIYCTNGRGYVGFTGIFFSSVRGPGAAAEGPREEDHGVSSARCHAKKGPVCLLSNRSWRPEDLVETRASHARYYIHRDEKVDGKLDGTAAAPEQSPDDALHPRPHHDLLPASAALLTFLCHPNHGKIL